MVSTEQSPGLPVLDLVRYHEHLMGTKIGCREGDCGACTVLVGTLEGEKLRYRSMTSCLLPLANVEGCHVVTIEGLNLPQGEDALPLNKVQEAMAAEGATQCGFCTPGFVVSLAGHCISHDPGDKSILASIDGNICRCTGYKSIERAARILEKLLEARAGADPIKFAVDHAFVPSWFSGVKEKLRSLQAGLNGVSGGEKRAVGGGTDLYVQQPEKMIESPGRFVFHSKGWSALRKNGREWIIGASATVSDLLENAEFCHDFPRFKRYGKLISSTPIRNMGTIAGNFVNASPIGDLSIIFLALGARLTLVNPDNDERREIPLRSFFLDYKKTALSNGELIEKISCPAPAQGDLFHFEKVSKRTHLDIASVNTALFLRMESGLIREAGLSAGGVGPVPLYLEKTSSWLEGKQPGQLSLGELAARAKAEISPISDARGSMDYKSLLLGQLVQAHFYELFTEKLNAS